MQEKMKNSMGQKLAKYFLQYQTQDFQLVENETSIKNEQEVQRKKLINIPT